MILFYCRVVSNKMSDDIDEKEFRSYLQSDDEDDDNESYMLQLLQDDKELYDCIMAQKCKKPIKKSSHPIPQKRFFCFEFTLKDRFIHDEIYMDTGDMILRLKQKYKNINYIEIRQHKINFDTYYLFVQQTRSCIPLIGFEKYLLKHYPVWKIEEGDIYNMFAADPESSIIAVHGGYRHRHNHEPRPSSSTVPISHHRSDIRYKKFGIEDNNNIISELKRDVLSEVRQMVKDIVPTIVNINDNSTNTTHNNNNNITNVYNVVIKDGLSINMYGNEDTYHIKAEDWKEMIQSTPELSEMICKALEKVRENPDNKNFIMKDRNDDHVGIKRSKEYEKIDFNSFSSDALDKYVEMVQHDSNMGNHVRGVIRNGKRRQGKESVNPVHRKLRDIAVRNYKDTVL